MAVILRPGKTPDGAEVARVLRHVVRAIRARWPRVEILVRGDSHYGRPEAMAWCERHRVGSIFGLAGNKVLLARVARLAEDAALGRVAGEGGKVRRYGEFAYAAGTWGTERRVIARVEASGHGQPVHRHQPRRRAALALRGRVLRPRPSGKSGQGAQAALGVGSDVVHQGHRQPVPAGAAHAAYWLLHTLRGLAPKTSFWRAAQFDTLRLLLIKVAGRVTELATRIKLALPSSYPYRASLVLLATRAAKPP